MSVARGSIEWLKYASPRLRTWTINVLRFARLASATSFSTCPGDFMPWWNASTQSARYCDGAEAACAVADAAGGGLVSRRRRRRKPAIDDLFHHLPRPLRATVDRDAGGKRAARPQDAPCLGQRPPKVWRELQPVPTRRGVERRIGKLDL